MCRLVVQLVWFYFSLSKFKHFNLNWHWTWMQLLWNSWNFAQLNNQSHFTQRDVQHRYYSAQTLVCMKQFEKSIVYNILFVNSRRLVALKCCYLFTVISLDLREEKEYTKFIEKVAKVKENLKILLDISAVQSCWSEKQELCSKRVVLFIEKCIIIQDESSFCVLQRTSWLFSNRAIVLWRFLTYFLVMKKNKALKFKYGSECHLLPLVPPINCQQLCLQSWWNCWCRMKTVLNLFQRKLYVFYCFLNDALNVNKNSSVCSEFLLNYSDVFEL